MIPLFVDCSDRRIVIFGGGGVAARKASYFSGKADVTVVSRSFSQKISSLKVSLRQMDVKSVPDDALVSLLEGAFLVIGALSDPVQNNRIGRLCRERGILFNNADGKAGDVILPSITGGDHYTIAISTQGNSPAVSRFIRQHLECEFPALDAMILLQSRLREELKSKEPDQAKRNAILGDVLDDRTVWEALRSDPGRAWELVRGRYLHD